MNSDDGSAFVTGAMLVLLAVFLVSQVFESACQTKHNVADCEWSRNPFTPTPPEAP